jgi:hypothetical protein
MGELINLNPPTPIADGDLPPSVARDSEVEEEIAAAIADHIPGNPHPQYEFKAGATFRQLLGARNFPANTWNSLGAFPGFPLGAQGSPSAILVAIGITWDISSPWQQTSSAGILSPVWWQPAVVADSGVRLAMEYHNQTESFIRIRAGLGSSDVRPIFIYPEGAAISIPATGRLDVILKRLL